MKLLNNATEKNLAGPRSAGSLKVMKKDFPEESFSIACVSDVCKGDEVLFSQAVFEGFDVAQRKGTMLGEFMRG